MGGRLRRMLDFAGSVKLAIPLLVLIALCSILGSFIPQGRNVRLSDSYPAWMHGLNDTLQLNDIFHSWWYLMLLGLLGVSLLAITARRAPRILGRRGIGAGTGILMAHLGVLVVLGGVAYGSLNGFRYYTHLIEGEVTVVPALPFVIKLDRLDLSYFPPGAFSHREGRAAVLERQTSEMTLLHHGTPFLQAGAAPGRPVAARGVTLLPAERDLGWVFDLVLEAGGKEKVVPIRPWAPPLITLGLGNPARILAHRLESGDLAAVHGAGEEADPAAEIFLLEEDGGSRSLGFASVTRPVTYEAWTIRVAGIRRYTGLHAYSRPETPFLIAGILILLTGLGGAFTRWGARLLPGRWRLAGPAGRTGGRLAASPAPDLGSRVVVE